MKDRAEALTVRQTSAHQPHRAQHDSSGSPSLGPYHIYLFTFYHRTFLQRTVPEKKTTPVDH